MQIKTRIEVNIRLATGPSEYGHCNDGADGQWTVDVSGGVCGRSHVSAGRVVRVQLCL